MEKLAIHVSPGNPKPVGFKTGSGFLAKVTVGGEDEDDTDECDGLTHTPVA